MSNPQSEALDKLEQYTTAFHLIADQVQQQIALEQHQRKNGLPFASIECGRADVYQKIALTDSVGVEEALPSRPDLARRFDRSLSWVRRRLALVE